MAEFPRKREPSARAACPLKANVLIEVRYHSPLGGLSMPSLILPWKVETATLLVWAVGTSHAGVGQGRTPLLSEVGRCFTPITVGTQPSRWLACRVCAWSVQATQCLLRHQHRERIPLPRAVTWSDDGRWLQGSACHLGLCHTSLPCLPQTDPC